MTNKLSGSLLRVDSTNHHLIDYLIFMQTWQFLKNINT